MQISVRILTVDDHLVFREGLAMVIATQPDMRLVAEAANGREAFQQFRAHWPDLTLMDLKMRGMNGLDAMVAIRNSWEPYALCTLGNKAGK
jgi:DNA-binding NarL/FixJ family response regulator